MTEEILYAWANPLELAPIVDHTWVTNYTEEIKTASAAGREYWYCWGVKHDTARANLVAIDGKREIATAISPPNVPSIPDGQPNYAPSSTSGSIVYYGLDGVCHNVANQVLASTATTTDQPVRVHGANGYPISSFFFGTYGLNASGWDHIVNSQLKGLKLGDDDFIGFLDEAVSPGHRAKILEYRLAAQLAITALREYVSKHAFNYYPPLALIAVASLAKIEDYLPENEFKALFPSLSDPGDIKNEAWLYPPGSQFQS